MYHKSAYIKFMGNKWNIEEDYLTIDLLNLFKCDDQWKILSKREAVIFAVMFNLPIVILNSFILTTITLMQEI